MFSVRPCSAWLQVCPALTSVHPLLACLPMYLSGLSRGVYGQTPKLPQKGLGKKKSFHRQTTLYIN